MPRLLNILEENVPDPHSVKNIPREIVLKGKMLKAFTKRIPYFEVLNRWEGRKPSYTLSAERLFEGDEGEWEMFVRVFFPFSAPQLRDQAVLETNEHGAFRINPDVYTKEEIEGLFDFLAIPQEKKYDLLKELSEVHTLHSFYTRRPSLSVGLPLRSGYNPNLALTPKTNENNVSYNANNENEQENNDNKNDNDNVYSKLSKANYTRFVGTPKARKGKTRKLKKKTK